jgi:hypothetical protein
MSWRSFCTALHLTCLGLWAGGVLISGATAAVAFPTLHEMNVHLPDIPDAFQGDAYRFTAGAVAQRVFLIADMLSFACAMIAGITLLALFFLGGLERNRPSTYVRALAYGIALASLAATLFVVTPSIAAASRDHLRAAKAGDTAAADLARRASADLHPLATNLLVAEFLGATLALFVGALAAARASVPAPSPTVSGSPTYPEPALLKRSRR